MSSSWVIHALRTIQKQLLTCYQASSGSEYLILVELEHGAASEHTARAAHHETGSVKGEQCILRGKDQIKDEPQVSQAD